VPQYLPDSRNAADFIAMYEILLVNKPVFVLELKPPSHLEILSKRQAADEQIRMRMGDLVGQRSIRIFYHPLDLFVGTCPLDTLYAVSALGTRLCFYTLDTTNEDAAIVPISIQRHPTRVNDTAPATRWAYDILEPAGEQQFSEIVEGIKVQCAALDG
jgi:hypothetical protein